MAVPIRLKTCRSKVFSKCAHPIFRVCLRGFASSVCPSLFKESSNTCEKYKYQNSQNLWYKNQHSLEVLMIVVRDMSGLYSRAVVWRCSVKKLFLKISKNSQETTCARVSINKIAGFSLQHY